MFCASGVTSDEGVAHLRNTCVDRCAGVTGLSLLITPFIMQLSTRYLQLDSDDGKVRNPFPPAMA